MLVTLAVTKAADLSRVRTLLGAVSAQASRPGKEGAEVAPLSSAGEFTVKRSRQRDEPSEPNGGSWPLVHCVTSMKRLSRHFVEILCCEVLKSSSRGFTTLDEGLSQA